MLDRRAALLGAAALVAVSSGAARAASKMARIAIVHASHPVAGMTETGITQYRAFFHEMRQLGYVEGRNLAVDRWSADGQAGRYLELARAAVAKNPEVILAGGQGPVAALKAATQTIPIVGIMSDPVAAGLAFSLAQPGGNLTGVAIDAGEAFHGKRLELLLEMVPSAKRVAYLLSADRSDVGVPVSVLDFAKHRGVGLFAVRLEGNVPLPAYKRAFAIVAQERADALFVGTAPVHLTHRATIVSLANAARIPASYQWRDFVELGGLMSYAPSLADLYGRCAGYVDRILKGANPAELPILQPEKFELALNLKTAKALGIAVPESLLARADEVIE
jgi:putative ABC transport system substrate-binding protein